MNHTTVFKQKDVYAGWPANHGSWQWGDEFLVGFMIGIHGLHGMHNIEEPFAKMLSRSYDGGESWHSYAPTKSFNATKEEIEANKSMPPAFVSKGDILRFCGGYDHGGETCVREGGYYISSDKGTNWDGPFPVSDKLTAGFHCTTRTCVLDDLVFVSFAAQNHWGSDCTIVGRIESGKFVSFATVLNDEYRAVMPAVAKVSDRIVVCLRRRGPPKRGGWIDSVYSDDNGKTWSAPVHVADTGIHNGNPPALIERGGDLYCAYANRSDNGIWVSQSIDLGKSWYQLGPLRQGECSDIGYPRLFKRRDGGLVCVYYWSDEGEAQRIEATEF